MARLSLLSFAVQGAVKNGGGLWFAQGAVALCETGEQDGGRLLFVRELLCPPERREEVIQMLLASHKAAGEKEEVCLRLPPSPGKERGEAFGMLRPLTPRAEAWLHQDAAPYLGLRLIDQMVKGWRESMIQVFLAPGFEEIEALTTVDILRRAGLETVTVAVGTPDRTVEGAHGITVTADIKEDEAEGASAQALVLPGGMPGTRNLEKSAAVGRCIEQAAKTGAYLCAICAAPSILGHKGFLNGRQAVCFPGFEQELEGAVAPPRSGGSGWRDHYRKGGRRGGGVCSCNRSGAGIAGEGAFPGGVSPMPVGDIRPLKAGMRERYKAIRRAMTPQEKARRITPLPRG